MKRRKEIRGHIFYGVHHEQAFYDGKPVAEAKRLDVSTVFKHVYAEREMKPVVGLSRKYRNAVTYWRFNGAGWEYVDDLDPVGPLEYWLCTEDFEVIKPFVDAMPPEPERRVEPVALTGFDRLLDDI